MIIIIIHEIDTTVSRHAGRHWGVRGYQDIYLVCSNIAHMWSLEVMITPEEAIPFLIQDMAVAHDKLFSLYAERHDGVDDIVVVLLESLYGLLP